MELTEDELVEAIARVLSGDTPGVLVGIGDDAAVVEAGAGPSVLTTDLLVEDVHFEAGTISARDLGRKAIAVNVSDLAAMGAESYKVEWKDNPDTRLAAMAPVGGRAARDAATGDRLHAVVANYRLGAHAIGASVIGPEGDEDVRAGHVTARAVSAGESVTPVSKIATIVRIQPIRLQLAVKEADAVKVHPGQRVQAEVKGYPDVLFSGAVSARNVAIDVLRARRPA